MLFFGVLAILGGLAFLLSYFRDGCAGGFVGMPEICGPNSFYLALLVSLIFIGIGIGSIIRHFRKN